MLAFFDWLFRNDTADLLRLLEAAEFFRPDDYNQVFDAELERTLDRLPNSEAKQQASELRGFDWASYIARSLLRAGFGDNDAEQEAFHEIVVKLLVSPGKLFQWHPERHGPLEKRFRNSVWNAIRNLVEKTRNRWKRMTLADPTVMARTMAGRHSYNNLIDEFRTL